MQPAHHEQALVAFFLRHNLIAPVTDADALIARHGLVLAMAVALRDGGFRVSTGALTATIDGVRFTREEVALAGAEAHKLAHLIEDILDGKAADPDGTMVDRMAFLMRSMARASVDITPDALVSEGIPEAIVIEYAIEAAQLAEAMKVGVAHWWKASRAREALATNIREAA